MKEEKTLYQKEWEHDSCGCGLVCNTKGIASHDILEYGLDASERMKHRCASGAEENSGDGAGILTDIPHQFLLEDLLEKKLISNHNDLPQPGHYGLAMVFLPQNEPVRVSIIAMIEKLVVENGFKTLAWREVPTNNSQLGRSSVATEPKIKQLFLVPKNIPNLKEDPYSLERKLYLCRRRIEKAAIELQNEYTKRIKNIAEKETQPLSFANWENFYFCSFSSMKVVYKGMLLPTQLRPYFLDVIDARYKTSSIIFHTRFSTNTFPSWPLAHPFRFLSHNGEINTIHGNINWMQARYSVMQTKYFTSEELDDVLPILSKNFSDSRNLDLAVELLVMCGRSITHALSILMPSAWEKDKLMPTSVRSFFEYNASFCEPWDGPAGVYFNDGIIIGGKLDRNGLRPARYSLYEKDIFVSGSESGVVPLPDSMLTRRSRLRPGELMAIDRRKGAIVKNEEILEGLANMHPYAKWLQKQTNLREEIKKSSTKLSNDEKLDTPSFIEGSNLTTLQKAFGFTEEELRIVLPPMFIKAQDPVGSMGNDTPLAVLSSKSQNLFNYFHQLFAQVTNPPIDSIREKSFMSLLVYLGTKHNMLEDEENHGELIKLKRPVLTPIEFSVLKKIGNENRFKTVKLPITFKANNSLASCDGSNLEAALKKLTEAAAVAIDEGANILLLSDCGVSSENAAIPNLLAVSTLHHYLIKIGKRSKASIVIESGEARQMHHFCVLLGYGANAIFPYMAYETIAQLVREGSISSEENSIIKMPSLQEANDNFVKAVDKGVLKIISKMGISTIRSYQGAQIFEAVGLSDEVINKYFTGTVSRLGGLGLKEIEHETLLRHRFAFPQHFNLKSNDEQLETGGTFQWRQRGEAHLFSPKTIHKLQLATRLNDKKIYKEYSDSVNLQQNQQLTLRGCLQFKGKVQKPLPLSEVESTDSIFKRFATGAMSYGSISLEAHTMLAVAMNRIGGKSNTGEGGEDNERYTPLKNGDNKRSAIKQVASGRFGVTAEYLTNADDLQIKISQGAKPGEGGQLPGHKVDAAIAKVRHSTRGVSLISPPPHHDIYSIEDLAQLISDLKHANDRARVSVKLVSAAGVGTIAAGVTKCIADHIVIAGFDGGTGASPLVSIRHAGLPWELGLAETHQTLVKNRLRNRVFLQADGQMKTGRDLAIATLLGAEEWGVATAALVTMGCIIMRKCHLNTCPVGIATQDNDLRKLFTGEVQHVVNFFHFIAEELREIMAMLGFQTIDEMVGRTDKLMMRSDISHPKAKTLDFSKILMQVDPTTKSKQFRFQRQVALTQNAIDRVWATQLTPLFKERQAMSLADDVKNTDRSVGTVISSMIERKFGRDELEEDTLVLNLTGTAGQSFAAFSVKGVTFKLTGGANDYFGKGLSGAKIIVKPNPLANFVAAENSIIGNVSFYGATSGQAYINGKAGERFCVRNSGAEVVVEQIGDHGCEYMTGGKAIILGKIGRNFAAGMSGGIAYLWDPEGVYAANVNPAMVLFERIESASEKKYLLEKITNHSTYTNSLQAQKILENFDVNSKHFLKLMPIDYKAALNKLSVEASTISDERAEEEEISENNPGV